MEKLKVKKENRKFKQVLTGLIFPPIIVLGWSYPLLGYFIPFCMLLGMSIGVARGRKWCDWYCPRGSFFESVLSAVSPKVKIPALFKNMYFRIAVFCFLMSMMTWQIIARWPNPYKIGMFFVTLLTVTTVVALVLNFFFHPRTWCIFCPIGTTGNWLGRWKEPLNIKSSLCIECKLCYNNCPMQIKPYEFKKSETEIVKDADCLKCNLCIAACPRGALIREGNLK